MAPISQTSTIERDRKQQKPGEPRKSDLVCRVKYCNTLPDIPFDPKFITYPFETARYINYKPTNLEKHYKHDLLTEHDLGVTIDLINPDTYSIDPNTLLHPDDERLLEEDNLTPQDSKRSRHHNKTVPWLKKTEYISNEFNRYGHSTEKTETKVGYNVKKLFKSDILLMDRDSQLAVIEKTFSDAKIPITKHFNKPNVYAVEERPIFPDFKLWKYPFAQVSFDADSVTENRTEVLSQAMIRGVLDSTGQQFVAYFLPMEETMEKRKKDDENGIDYKEDEPYDYKLTREYNWNIKNKATKGFEENFFLVFRDDKAYYNELESRVRLTKRRLKPGQTSNLNQTLVIRHRPLTKEEFDVLESRGQKLDQPAEEEEEDDEEETTKEEKEEEKEVKDDDKASKSPASPAKSPASSSSSSAPNSPSSSDSEGDDSKNDKKKKRKVDSDAEKSKSKNSASSSSSRASSPSSPVSEDEKKKSESDTERKKSGSSSEGEKSNSSSDEEGETKAGSSSDERRKRKRSSSSSSASSRASSSSKNESDDEVAKKRIKDDQTRRVEEEIFGSDSD